ncbi:MAG TPA: AI-2E family transporter [Solirubrobacteraceae bacterium]|nr:AI-2E family transporter [Solirubrobacteraceae bacterium]
MEETESPPDDPATEASETSDGGDRPESFEEEVEESLEQPAWEPVLVPRWIQLVLLPLALIGLFELCKAAGSVFVVLLAASVIALILNPLTKLFQRAVPRGFAIVAAYLAVVVIFLAIIGLLSEPVANEVTHVADNFPSFVRKANNELKSVQNFFDRHGIRLQLAQQGHSALQSIEKRVLKSSGSIVSFSKDVLGKAVSLGVDLVLTFVLSLYLLVYARPIGDLVRRLVPPGDGTPQDDYPLLIQHAVSGYMRGQLLFSTIMGGSAGIAMALMGLVGVFPDGSKYALFFALFYGLMELIPYIGPILGPIPPIFVALVTNPISAVWVLLVFVGLQQLEGHVVAPQVFRFSLRINPILVILSLLIGYQIYGVAGALLALPIATVTRQTVLYLRKHLVLEPWTTNPPL